MPSHKIKQYENKNLCLYRYSVVGLATLWINYVRSSLLPVFISL